MRHAPIKVLAAVVAVAALATGCATRLEMGPGYYHYDSRLASAPVAPASTTSTTVVTEPVVVYREPAVVRFPY